MLKEFFKPNKRNIFLTIFLLLITGVLFFMLFFIGVPVPKGLALLKILSLPFNIVPLFSLSLFFIIVLFIITILWLYLLSCALILLKRKLFTMEWTPKKLLILVVIIILGFVVYGFFNFGWGDIFIPTADDSGATAQGVNDIVKANNQFAIDLYSEINKDSNENIFFSPWSISTAVAMAYEGARGETASEIQSVFHFPVDDSSRRFSYAKMLNTLNKASGKYKLHTVNAIWLQEDYPFLDEYKNTISRYYLGEIKNLDFVKNPSDSSFQINNFVSKNTNNKIKNIVSPGVFNNLTRTVLTNAIYFKGKWEHQFDRDDTKPEDFTLESGQKIKIPMMRLIDQDLDFNYAESDGIQILEMPYQGDKISMLILLPRTDISNSRFREYENQAQISSITELESILTEEKLQEWRNKLQSQAVYIYMPKYKFETSYRLTDYLKMMRLELPFKVGEANFSGMDGTNNLYISDILHNAYIDVYEEGTEAAAATVISGGVQFVSNPKYAIFRADHPFIFIIQEKETGNIIFMGKVSDPTQQ